MKLMINESNEDFDIELYDSLYDYCDDIEAELNKYSGKSYDTVKSFMERNGFHFEESNGLTGKECQEMWSKYYDGNLVTVDLWFDVVKGDRRRSVGDFLRCSANFELYKRYDVTESLNESYKDYWAYKEVSSRWDSDVQTFTSDTDQPGAYVTIWFDKKAKDIYAMFRIERDEDFWYVYDETDGDMLINDSIELDEENGTLDDAIQSCFYYFNTRY
jgi:hypothetical protein